MAILLLDIAITGANILNATRLYAAVFRQARSRIKRFKGISS
ncbi:hypothetical protein [Streptomyces litchfieldiae]|uniref:Uncharacterized protein n=1 Tax=Streptomyces litchfieldiae TaxID=3075543 RepID=A0ABU2MXQ6_9ACTN|nr:hypothetical protein [Streptomyces sp. DSM 44938]MDT0346446.1 hypothetical protein [Streptomyces sp. DSM 44938]